MSTTIPARIGDLWAFFVDLMDCDGFFPFFFPLFSPWFFGGLLLGDFYDDGVVGGSQGT